MSKVEELKEEILSKAYQNIGKSKISVGSDGRVEDVDILEDDLNSLIEEVRREGLTKEKSTIVLEEFLKGVSEMAGSGEFDSVKYWVYTYLEAFEQFIPNQHRGKLKMNKLDNFSEYLKEVQNVIENGGVLYFIERTDTNEFAYEKPSLNSEFSSSPNYGSKDLVWMKEVSLFIGLAFSLCYLTKEEAQEELDIRSWMEGGCHVCHNGGNKIPVEVTEHLFVTPTTTKEN
jgi:hypothetical protein